MKKILLLTLAMIISPWILGCNNNSSPQESVDEQPMIGAEEKKGSLDSESNLDSEKSLDEDVIVSFNPTDTSTWGEVTETNSNGEPTQYMRELPNGNVQILSFMHALKNKKFEPNNRLANSEFIHWDLPNPAIPITILDGTSKEWRPMVRKYARVWSRSSVFNLIVQQLPGVSDAPSFALRQCIKPRPGRIVVCNYDFQLNPKVKNKNGGYAVTENTKDGHILHGIVHLNDNHAAFDENHPGFEERTETLANGIANMNFVVCHELGHILGLDHFTDDKLIPKGTCMDYNNNPFPNLQPDHHDLEELERVYSHSHAKSNTKGGVICKSIRKSTGTIFEHHHRVVSYNGVLAIGVRTKPFRGADKKILNPQKIIFDLGNQYFSYQYNDLDPDNNHTDSYSNNTSMKADAHPSIGSPTVHVTARNRANPSKLDIQKYFDSLISQSASTASRERSCERASNDKLFDIGEFTPPKNEQFTGGYDLISKRDANGKEVWNDRGVIQEYKAVNYRYNDQSLQYGSPVVQEYSTD